MSKVTITKDAENPIAVEILESAIVEIGAAMQRINKSRLTRHGLVVLICAHTKLSKKTVEAVLESLDDLEKRYLKKKE